MRRALGYSRFPALVTLGEHWNNSSSFSNVFSLFLTVRDKIS